MEGLLVKDKYDTYMEAHEDGVEHAALGILMDRFNEGYWYDNWDDGNPRHQWEDRARRIIEQAEANHPKAPGMALKFLFERSDHEYEYVEVQTIQGT